MKKLLRCLALVLLLGSLFGMAYAGPMGDTENPLPPPVVGSTH